jgi:hypothetical protein
MLSALVSEVKRYILVDPVWWNVEGPVGLGVCVAVAIASPQWVHSEEAAYHCERGDLAHLGVALYHLQCIGKPEAANIKGTVT